MQGNMDMIYITDKWHPVTSAMNKAGTQPQGKISTGGWIFRISALEILVLT